MMVRVAFCLRWFSHFSHIMIWVPYVPLPDGFLNFNNEMSLSEKKCQRGFIKSDTMLKTYARDILVVFLAVRKKI